MATLSIHVEVDDDELRQSDISLDDFFDLAFRLACTATDIPLDSFTMSLLDIELDGGVARGEK